MTRRVLICEDEMIVALDLQLILEDLEFDVLGPFRHRRVAFSAVARARPDAAILDVHLLDGEVFPLAMALIEAGIPVVFHSGHADARDISTRFPAAQVLTKPICAADLATALQGILPKTASEL